MAIISIAGISLLIIFALLQIAIHNHCWRHFHKTHQNRAAIILFSLFILALIGFYLHSIVFTYTLFSANGPEIGTDWISVYRNAYEWSKYWMTLYFINKIYFSFSNSIFQINKTYLVIMAIVAAFNPINEVLTSFDVLSENGLRLLIATVISSVADLILMIFYSQNQRIVN